MNNSNYLYNNEALSSIVLGHFMSVHKTIDIAKILLVLPFVLHDPTVRSLKNNSHKRSLEEFIIKNINSVLNFNSRFEDYLPLTVNSLTILLDSGVIAIEGQNINFIDSVERFDLSSNRGIGKRILEIFKANEHLSDLMHIETVNAFYLKLRISL
jgi:hypothetical protein